MRDRLQITANASGSVSSWGRQAPGQLVTDNIGVDVLRQQPDLGTGLAVDALPWGGSGFQAGGSVPYQLAAVGGSGWGQSVPVLIPGPGMRWRWRFGVHPDYDGPDGEYGWCASIASTENGVSDTDVGTHLLDAAAPAYASFVPGWECSAALYEVDPGASNGLSEDLGAVQQHFGNGSKDDARFIAVGAPNAASVSGLSNAVMVLRAAPVDSCINAVTIDLGFDWQPGDLFTWDVTWPEGADLITHKVWRQRGRTDAPVSAGFKLPASWHPWGESSGIGTGPTVRYDRGAVGYHHSEQGWTSIGANVTVTQSGTTVGVVIEPDETAPPSPWTGPYAAWSVVTYDADGILDSQGGSGLLQLGGSASIEDGFAGFAVVSTDGRASMPTADSNPLWVVNPNGPQLQARPVALSLQAVSADPAAAMRWVGFTQPRHSDNYQLFGF